MVPQKNTYVPDQKISTYSYHITILFTITAPTLFQSAHLISDKDHTPSKAYLLFSTYRNRVILI